MEHKQLRAFNKAGLDQFKRVMQSQLREDWLDPLDPLLSEEIEGSAVLNDKEFATSREMAAEVLSAFSDLEVRDYLGKTGLWAWLTFVLRDQLFKRDDSGRLRVQEYWRWYPSAPGDWQKGQRHLVRMPVLLLRELRGNADHLLATHPSVLPEIREQLTSQNAMSNKEFQVVAKLLYFDVSTGKLRRGAGGKGGGSPRRLAKVRQQFDVTWEIEELGHERILELLPKEFDRFRREAG